MHWERIKIELLRIEKEDMQVLMQTHLRIAKKILR